MGKFIDITGKIFGRLTVLSRAKSRSGATMWNCRCECGKALGVLAGNLMRGTSLSCGCLRAEVSAERLTIHGGTSGPTYRTWTGMKDRCKNPSHLSWKYYGGKGVTIAERWMDFQNFLEDMGDKPSPDHTIDRIDLKGNYTPENCRWATLEEQGNNKSNNRYITVGCCTLTTAQWTKERGFLKPTIHTRLARGWSERDAVMKPIKRRAIPA